MTDSHKKRSKSQKQKQKSKSKKNKTSEGEADPYIEHLRKKFFKSEEYDETFAIDESEQVSFAWDDISYSIEKKKGLPCAQKVKNYNILKNVSGYCPAGTLTAILGPSGAGKTSLLNILSRRTKGGDVSGDLWVNEKKPSEVSFNKIASYVAQEDVVMGSLTAEEVLEFTAQLKLPATMSDDEKSEYVEKLLKNIGLYHVRKNLVGYAGTTTGARSGIKRGLSGGERKRVSICLELVANPKILFLDEPTSGLDSYAALSVIQLLRNLAFMGRTVICTIHQPSSDVLKLFDNVMLLSRGQTMYFGPLHKSVPYFTSIGYEPPTYINPAEYMLKIISVPDIDDKEDEEDPSASYSVAEAEKSIQRLGETFAESKLAKKVKDGIKHMKNNPRGEVTYNQSDRNFCKQYGLLVNRNVLNIMREPALFRVRVFISLFFAIITAILWWQLEENRTDGLERISALFFILTSQLFGGLSGPSQVFTNERPVFYREKSSGLYSVVPFYLAKLTTEVPLNILVPVATSAIAYWAINFNSSFENYILFTLFFVLVTNVAHGLGMVLASAFEDSTTGTRVQPLIIMPLFLFSGFFVNADSIPVFFRWIEYISFFKYAFRGTAVSVFQGLDLNCTFDELTNVTASYNISIPVNISGVMTNVTQTVAQNISICAVTSGEQILKSLALYPNGTETPYPIEFDYLFLIINFFVFNIFAFLLLACCKRE